ncbi:MAG: DEAD/DEAH box helicase, partial [Thermodesulfobacteriota bacterium]
AIPPALEGRDLIGTAQTGTGKTAAFVLPILHKLLNGPRNRSRVLIVTPTRELAEQIHQVIRELGAGTGIRSATIYGGVGMGPQVNALRNGVEILVACPGRLLDHIDQGNARLNGIQFLVLDEADRMFDMGFLPDIRRILKKVPVRRQTLLFSATMPMDVRYLAEEAMRDPVTAQAGDSGPASTVSHALYPVEPHLKTALLMKLLHRTSTDSVLVFTRTKHRATRLATRMKRAGFAAISLQGDMSQQSREKALTGFRDGTYRILVATDIASRGIDVSSISHVINYDMPDTVDAYTHRIGRTGRAERTGDAFTFVTSEDGSSVLEIERALGQKLENRILKEFDYSAPPPARDAWDDARSRFNGSAPYGAAPSSGQRLGSAGAPGNLFRGTLPYTSPRRRARKTVGMR